MFQGGGHFNACPRGGGGGQKLFQAPGIYRSVPGGGGGGGGGMFAIIVICRDVRVNNGIAN